MCDELSDSGNFPGLDALGTDSKFLRSAVYPGANSLKIRQPSTLCSRSAERPRSRVNVSYILTELRPLAAHVANVRHILRVLLGKTRRRKKHE